MKAVVLSGGQGTRLRPLSWSVPKQLVPVGGRSVLAHVLADIAAAGITEAVVVVSPESQGPVEELLAEPDGPALRTDVVVQAAPRGLADALATALPAVGDGPVLLYLGDCLITGGIGHVLEAHASSEAAATLLVAEVDDPSRYGIVEVTDGRITALVEKPSEPRSNLAIVGVYAFAAGIGAVLERVTPSWRGEYEITDAVQLLVDDGDVVVPAELRGWWMDTGTIADALEAMTRLLDEQADDRRGELHDTSVDGRVVVAPGAVVRDSRLIGPVTIAAGAHVSGSVVGPHVTIGADAGVRDATIRRSIVMGEVDVTDSVLVDSVLGPRSIVRGAGQAPASVVVGADAVVSLDIANQAG